MLPSGHLAASYLIAKTYNPKKTRWQNRGYELLIMFFGAGVDFDMLATPLLGLHVSQHHFLPSHTPFGVILLWLILYKPLSHWFDKRVLWLALAAGLFHLVLDDVSYWLHLWGLQIESIYPQIFWLFPFDPRRDGFFSFPVEYGSAWEILWGYITKAPLNVLLEVIITGMAGAVFVKTEKTVKHLKWVQNILQ
jgi:hypothetical protein